MKELVAIAEQIAERLVARHQTIAVAESSTGGLISAALLAVPGASAYSWAARSSIREMRGGSSSTFPMTQ
jgi:nicotinamide mononucleotide (NMN) deamidase PncC